MKKWPQRKINQTPCGESCHLLTKVDVRSEKVLTGELGTIKPSALPYITTQKTQIEKNPENGKDAKEFRLLFLEIKTDNY